MRSRRWGEPSTAGRVLIVVLSTVQVALAISAWADLAQRPGDRVNGSKRTWAAVIASNLVGPLLYFKRGRKP